VVGVVLRCCARMWCSTCARMWCSTCAALVESRSECTVSHKCTGPHRHALLWQQAAAACQQVVLTLRLAPGWPAARGPAPSPAP
jgi:hypothetical protein